MKTTLLATLVYTVFVFFMLLYLGSDYGILYLSVAYAVPTVFVACFSSFLVSTVVKNSVRRLPARLEAGLFLLLPALLSNALAIAILQDFVSAINLMIYLASLVTIFFGMKFYRSTWERLDELASL